MFKEVYILWITNYISLCKVNYVTHSHINRGFGDQYMVQKYTRKYTVSINVRDLQITRK